MICALGMAQTDFSAFQRRHSKVTSRGFGTSSCDAPVAASTPSPIIPPTKTLPATPAAPAPAVLCDTFVTTVWHPERLTVTSSSDFLGSLNVHGVDVQVMPLLSSTWAPCGVEFTTKASVVPLVTVAQPVTKKTTAPTAKNTFMITPCNMCLSQNSEYNLESICDTRAGPGRPARPWAFPKLGAAS